MNIKKHYLIKVWTLPDSNIHKGTSEHDKDGFHLAQEKIIKITKFISLKKMQLLNLIIN